MLARGEFDLADEIVSDTRACGRRVDRGARRRRPQIRCMRDATRRSQVRAQREPSRGRHAWGDARREADVPGAPGVAGAQSELLGDDPMHVANEGRFRGDRAQTLRAPRRRWRRCPTA